MMKGHFPLQVVFYIFFIVDLYWGMKIYAMCGKADYSAFLYFCQIYLTFRC